jgi:hypothetical protein
MLASFLQNQMSNTSQKAHPEDPANSHLKPASNVVTQDIGQNLGLTYDHQ